MLTSAHYLNLYINYYRSTTDFINNKEDIIITNRQTNKLHCDCEHCRKKAGRTKQLPVFKDLRKKSVYAKYQGQGRTIACKFQVNGTNIYFPTEANPTRNAHKRRFFN